MAELGIAASGIGIASLGLQVGDCIVRLKKFLDAVKDSSEEIKYLVEEIETLSLVLSEFETKGQTGLHVEHESTSKCLRFCQKAVSILSDTVMEIEVEIAKRRRFGSVKAVLKTDAIRKLRERLVTAQSILMLSNQIYLVELQELNRQSYHEWAQAHQQELQKLRVIVSQPTKTILLSTSSQETAKQVLTSVETVLSTSQSKYQESTNEVGNKHQKVKAHSKRQGELRARFLTPNWLFGVSRAIDIYGSRANAGWNFNIQVYNVIPRRSPVFEMVQDDDIIGIQHLFSTGQASPFDRDEYGYTILDIAAGQHRLEVCRLLKNEGADPNISKHSSALVSACGMYSAEEPPDTFLHLVQFLSQDIDPWVPFDHYMSGAALCDVDVFAWILQQLNPTYQQRSLEECVLFAIKICVWSPLTDIASLATTILKGKNIDENLCYISDQKHKTLLHCAAYHLAMIPSTKWKQQGDRWEKLLNLTSNLIKGGSKLHSITVEGRTPMLEILSGLSNNTPNFPADLTHYTLSSHTSKGAIPLKTWLKLLKGSGADLVEYGEEEKRVLENPATNREWTCREFGNLPNFSKMYNLRLISFTYGPEPDDWIFWFGPVMEHYFTDFWEMIDHPERAMPGAWEESEERYSDDDYSN